MNFEVNVRTVEFGSVKALVSVTIGDLEIRGFRVIEQNDGDPWVAMPSREFQKEGDRQFFNIVYIADAKKKEEFCNKILEAYREKLSLEPS